MYIVHVFIHVKPDFCDAFIEETLANVRNSLGEPGIARFDFIRETERPDRFLLIEVYRTPEDAVRHKETEHYRRWRDAVAHMMEMPRSSVKFSNLSPGEKGWDCINP